MDARFHTRRLIARASFGPRPGELDPLALPEPEAWLDRQLELARHGDPQLEARLADFDALRLEPAEGFSDIGMDSMRARPGEEPDRRDLRRFEKAGRISREIAGEVAAARVVRAVHGSRDLYEVMVDFWSNHFSIFARKSFVGALLPHFQREVLDPHALGRFEDLLVAVATSPAMLVYLDNWNSTAPRRTRRRGERGGINENYARELLELHTLGVDGGYDQRDVREVARVLTGWTLESRREPVFRFRPFLHDAGRKTVMGERVEGEGMGEGLWLLRRLARHPSTARHIARKLAARFVADDPPPALVARAARRYLETDGSIPDVLRVVLLSPELRDPARRKLKTPLRFVVGAVRATGGQSEGGRPVLGALLRLGELPFTARTPAGFPEQTDYWVDPGALLERMSLAFALSRERLRDTRLGRAWPEGAPAAAGGAGSKSERTAVALAAPEFQWC